MYPETRDRKMVPLNPYNLPFDLKAKVKLTQYRYIVFAIDCEFSCKVLGKYVALSLLEGFSRQ